MLSIKLYLIFIYYFVQASTVPRYCNKVPVMGCGLFEHSISESNCSETKYTKRLRWTTGILITIYPSACQLSVSLLRFIVIGGESKCLVENL